MFKAHIRLALPQTRRDRSDALIRQLGTHPDWWHDYFGSEEPDLPGTEQRTLPVGSKALLGQLHPLLLDQLAELLLKTHHVIL